MADLKLTYDNEEDIPTEIENPADLYTKGKDGKYVFTGVAGIKTQVDIDKMDKGLTKEREKTAALKAKLSAFGDLDPDEVHSKLDRIDELEAASAGVLDKAGIEEIVAKRVEAAVKSKTSPLLRDLKKLNEERDALLQSNEQLSKLSKKRELRDHLQPLMVKAQIRPEHFEDVFNYAERHLERPEDAEGYFAKDGLGDGLTAGANMGDWLGEMVERRPGWIPPSTGGGARGSGGGGGIRGGNPFAKETWNLTAQHAMVRDKGEEYAERMARAAKTSIGSFDNAPKARHR